MTREEKNLILGCIDTLGVLLAEKGHQWTDGERAIYEAAETLLLPEDHHRPAAGPPLMPPPGGWPKPEPIEPESDGEEWKSPEED